MKDLKTLLGVIIFLIILLTIAQIIGQNKIIILAVILLAPLIFFIIIDEFKTESELKQFQKITLTILWILLFSGLMIFSHWETNLDKQLIKGRITTRMTEVEDDNGRISYVEANEFIPSNPEDTFKIESI